MVDTTVSLDQETDAKGRVQDYVTLLKPRVMSLVVFSGLAGLLVAPGSLHPLIMAVAVLCIAIGAGAAGAINMWYDRDIDSVMERTRGRPIVLGHVAPPEALAFGVVLSLFSVMLMGLAVNWTAAALLALANAFYVFVYTIWLKRRTPQNIVIGGAAGAFPPMIGWAAVTGGVSLESVVLFLMIFLWTPPHFWALALYRSGDYARANVPMMPVVAGADSTKWQMLLYTLVLLPVAVLPSILGTAGWIYGTAALGLGGLFVLCALRVLRDESHRAAKQMFAFSILYLFLLFALLILDRAPGLLSGSLLA
ncbi:heme o synthase [Fodinicurvata sediminis]|uniref:heme o synthase n=1 Tax=Fodinicurvata sediminis TaxID=1121832 RepID=UPI0003B6711A|nr:heme o synthase [Fodinicurvata sediminis]